MKKNSNRFISRVLTTEEQISELKDISIKVSKFESQKKKN